MTRSQRTAPFSLDVLSYGRRLCKSLWAGANLFFLSLSGGLNVRLSRANKGAASLLTCWWKPVKTNAHAWDLYHLQHSQENGVSASTLSPCKILKNRFYHQTCPNFFRIVCEYLLWHTKSLIGATVCWSRVLKATFSRLTNNEVALSVGEGEKNMSWEPKFTALWRLFIS